MQNAGRRDMPAIRTLAFATWLLWQIGTSRTFSGTRMTPRACCRSQHRLHDQKITPLIGRGPKTAAQAQSAAQGLLGALGQGFGAGGQFRHRFAQIGRDDRHLDPCRIGTDPRQLGLGLGKPILDLGRAIRQH